MLNLTPTIDWTKEDIVIEDNAGQRILIEGLEPSAHHLVLKNGIRTQGAYSIEQKGNYLAINTYYLPSDIRSTWLSESDLEDQRNKSEYYHMMATANGNEKTIYDEQVSSDMMQVRIYKNCKVSVVNHVTFHDGEMYYVAKMAKGGDVFYTNDWHNYPAEGEPHKPVYGTWTPIEVTTDEQVEKLARRLTRHELSDLSYILSVKNDVANGALIDRSYIAQFAIPTRQLLTEFFQPDAPENVYQLKNYNDNYISQGVIFCRPNNLVDWMRCPNKISQTDAKNQECKELLKLFTNSQIETNKTIRWTRSNDKIVAIMKNEKSGPMYVFAYNLKNHTRFYASRSPGGYWSFGIPSLHMLQNFRLNKTMRWVDDKRVYTHEEKVEIEGGLTVRELFDGTNIAWILDNAPDLVFYEDNYGTEIRTTIQEAISEKTMTQTVLNILATTGSTMLELLLKARLFNMYFIELMDEARAGSTRYKPFKTLEEQAQRGYTTALVYKPKASNLQEMFGMTMKQLRVYDEAIGKNQADTRYSCQVPKLYRLTNVLGLTKLSEMSLDTFKKAVEASMSRMGGSTVWDSMDAQTLREAGPTWTIEQKITVLSEYKDRMSIYRDYLRLRKTLKDSIAAAASTGRALDMTFNEKAYPVRPGKATRYFRRDENMQFSRFKWKLHSYACDENITLDYGNPEQPLEVTGAIVQMSPVMNMLFLHDDIQQWVSMYQDAAKEPMFAAATQRVQPLEWSDDKTGLQIIAPKQIRDIQEEGSVLSHCAASYVNPIIEGTENVMFVRKISRPTEPFFTVDIVGGNVRQVHCYSNGDLTKEGQAKAFLNSGLKVYEEYADVLGFLKKWAAAMKGLINADSLRTAYGALVANRS